MSDGVLRGLRGLRLPVRHQVEPELVQTLSNVLDELNIDHAGSSTWVAKEQECLKSQGEPSTEFRRVVTTVLRAAASSEEEPTHGATLALINEYFSIYARLREDHAYAHESAIAVLGYSLLVVDLAVHDRMSAAQTAKVLSGISPGLQFSRQAIKTITVRLKCEVAFDVGDVARLAEVDAASEPGVMADASLDEAAGLVALVAERLGVQTDLRPALSILSPVMQGTQIRSEATPYLQMLHYQCVTCEFCDHSPVDIYEFSPRGANAEAIFELYPDSIASAGNPFLNNAKSVEVIDDSWVRSKKTKDRSRARSLLELLVALESLGFSARRELASWLRVWLSRIIRVSKESVYNVPRPLLIDDIGRLLEAVALSESSTYGIIEQRVVDFVASERHVGLPSRGLGDSINATNRSASKFGDCEFADIASFTIFAYEAHAGHLSRWYILEHLRTLRRSIGARLEQLKLLSGGQGWSLKLTFVAHTSEVFEHTDVVINGMRVVLEVTTFESLVSGLDLNGRADEFDRLVVEQILGVRTPS
ncbi:MAG: hypothetical protein IPH14_12250, partial [Thermomonas sp.]|uniref:hypothetical protein n=1 Tax=Thermomonas sp. TaxID=1971895 RepID=UPI0025E883B9